MTIPNSPDDRADTVAAVRARLAAVERELRERDNDLAGSLGRQSASLRELTAEVAELRAAVDGLLEDPRYIPAPDWQALATESREAYDAELARLAGWVNGFLLPSYGCEQVIRPCWPAHLRAIWELGNIWAEWRRVYERPRPPLAHALAWHDRWLPGVLARLEAELAHCSSECRQARRRSAA